MEGEVSAMAAFLGQLTEAFTEILTCVTATATTIVGNPFLLFAGGVIGIMGRILSRN